MFPIPLGFHPLAYQEIMKRSHEIETKRIELDTRMIDVRKAMKDYIDSLSNHPSMSFSGMMYYGHLSGQYVKLQEEYKKYETKPESELETKPELESEVKPDINNDTTSKVSLRKRKVVNYKV